MISSNLPCGSIVALATPLHDNGDIDYTSLRRLVDWHIEQGSNGICVAGTTGESASLNVSEHHELIGVAVEHAAGRIPIMAGCGANSTAEAIALARHASRVGAHSQLQVVPYYNKPSQEGLYQHFRATAEAVPELPMVLYNVPGRTVADLQHETVLRLAQIPGIVGIKEASTDMARAQWLVRDLPQDFAIYSGDDLTAIALMLCGGHGSISVTANLAPQALVRLCHAALAGHAREAQAIQQSLLPLHAALFVQSNPMPLKFAMQRLGLCGPALRLPLTPLDAAYHAILEQALHITGLLPGDRQ